MRMFWGNGKFGKKALDTRRFRYEERPARDGGSFCFRNNKTTNTSKMTYWYSQFSTAQRVGFEPTALPGHRFSRPAP